MSEVKAFISDKNKKEVEEIKKLINEYKVFGIVDMENLPSLQLQRIKQQVKGKIVVRMSKKRLIKIAIDQLKESKKNIEQFKDKIIGMPAMVFTNDDPFILSKFLGKNTSPAPAKAGQIAPNDIIVKAGPTGFAPGPIIGELGQFGIKTGVEGGKLAIKEDKLLVKSGKEISAGIADILMKLKMEPMKVGLNLQLTYKDGEILGRDVLGIDEEKYIADVTLASSESINLAVSIGYLSDDTTYMVLAKAYREAKALEAKVEDKLDKPVEEVKEKSEEKKEPEQPKEEPKLEEKKEEAPKEEKPVEKKEEEVKEAPKEELKLPKEEPKLEPPKEEKKEVKEAPKEEPKVEEKKESLSTADLIDEIKKEDDAKIKVKEKTDFDKDAELAQEILRKATDQKIKEEKEKGKRVPSASDLAKK